MKSPHYYYEVRGADEGEVRVGWDSRPGQARRGKKTLEIALSLLMTVIRWPENTIRPPARNHCQQCTAVSGSERLAASESVQPAQRHAKT